MPDDYYYFSQDLIISIGLDRKEHVERVPLLIPLLDVDSLQ